MKIIIPFMIVLGLTQAPLRAQLPIITNQPVSQTVWAGGNVTFIVGLSGTGPFNYQWLFNSTNLSRGGIITTVAGKGTPGYSGDGGPATNASLSYPSDVVVDAGNLFIADYGNNIVRKVNTNGIITTVAGNGTRGYSGDGGQATNASFNIPSGVAEDASGNLFIADGGNNVIREVKTNGIIVTVAGKGTQGYSGDGGPATNASFNALWSVAVDASDNLYVADFGNSVIREVKTNGIIITVAGNGTQGYTGDGGPATNASLSFPSGVVVDAGNLFIVDGGNNIVRKVNTNGIITTVAGNGAQGYSGNDGPATNANLYQPNGVAVDASGNLFITDTGNDVIREVNTSGIITTVAGNGKQDYSGDGGPATNASFGYPSGLVVDTFGNLFIADVGNYVIREVTPIIGSSLALDNVTATNVGNYHVVVTGPGGSVTSSVVNLTVTMSPLIFQVGFNSFGNLTLDFVSQPGSTNVVLYTTNLLPPVVWQPLSTNIAGLNGDWQFTDTNAASHKTMFYRSRRQ